MELKELQSALEGVLFAAGEPVSVERLCLGLEVDRPTLDAVAQRLMDQYSYDRRGIRLVRLESSYQLCSAPEYADAIRSTLESRKPARLSQPALEVLAVIAYYQPVTRAYVDQVRGVDSSYTMGLLQERELIEEAGGWRSPAGRSSSAPRRISFGPSAVQPGGAARVAQRLPGGEPDDPGAGGHLARLQARSRRGAGAPGGE